MPASRLWLRCLPSRVQRLIPVPCRLIRIAITYSASVASLPSILPDYDGSSPLNEFRSYGSTQWSSFPGSHQRAHRPLARQLARQNHRRALNSHLVFTCRQPYPGQREQKIGNWTDPVGTCSTPLCHSREPRDLLLCPRKPPESASILGGSRWPPLQPSSVQCADTGMRSGRNIYPVLHRPSVLY